VIIQELLAEAGVAARSLSDLSKQLGVMGGAGAAVFGDHFEAGQDVEQKHIDNIQSVFDRFFGAQRREA
jgi:hypothetical protein